MCTPGSYSAHLNLTWPAVEHNSKRKTRTRSKPYLRFQGKLQPRLDMHSAPLANVCAHAIGVTPECSEAISELL